MRNALLAFTLFLCFAAGEAVTIDIKGLAFSPANVTIKAGQTVTWTNSDDRDHNVTEANGAFNSGKIAPGKSYTFTFKTAGKFSYADAYYPRMKGTITVKQ